MIFRPLNATFGTNTIDVNFRVADVSTFVSISGLDIEGFAANFFAGFIQYVKRDPRTGLLMTIDLSGLPFGCDPTFNANDVVGVTVVIGNATHIEGVLQIFRTNSVLS